MICTDVTTQAEFDAAAERGDCIHVVNSSRVVARGSSRVEARGSSSVVARGSSSVVARDSSSVVARDSSSVEAWDSSRVVARDSSSVVARDSSSVVARGSSSVEARGSSRVEAGRYVAIHRHANRHRGQITGGVVIDVPDPQDLDGADWCDYHGIPVQEGEATLYKGVGSDFRSGYNNGFGRTSYEPGSTVEAADWTTEQRCGGGLHLSPSPGHTHFYTDPERYVAVAVDVADIVSLGDKVKVPRCRVLHEVDRDGERVDAEVAR